MQYKRQVEWTVYRFQPTDSQWSAVQFVPPRFNMIGRYPLGISGGYPTHRVDPTQI